MTYYISTQTAASSMRQSILRLQTELAAGEIELSTGRHADIGLTLGARTGESLALQAEASFLQTLVETNHTVLTRLETADGVLGSLRASAQGLLETILRSGGSNQNTNAIKARAETALKGLIAGLNTAHNGDRIFAGTNTGTSPITNYYSPGSANKAAVDAAFLAAFGMPQTSPLVSSISGASMQSFLDTQFPLLFQGVNWSTDWSTASSQTMTNQISKSQTVNTSVSANSLAFQQLAQAYTMAADLGIETLNATAREAVTATARSLLTAAISNLIDIEASTGLVQESTSRATRQMSLQISILASETGSLEGVNPYEVAARVSNLQTQIAASYSLTSQLRQLSLVHFL
ncbi:MAG: flagellar hook-associated family protein [Beijerinckiaceae bacterium]|nr:flagellar hook-associated family protein [Beijerinckiaceae bacterium]